MKKPNQKWRHAVDKFKRFYNCWLAMRHRCLTPGYPYYELYGGREPHPIQVCGRWLCDREGFDNFVEDMGDRPQGTVLGRRLKEGHYEPSNCFWMNKSDTNQGRRASTRKSYVPKGRPVHHPLTIDGRTQSLRRWSREFGINYATVYYRIKKGLTPLQALTCPVGKGKHLNSRNLK